MEDSKESLMRAILTDPQLWAPIGSLIFGVVLLVLLK
jgi:hypothetical protein